MKQTLAIALAILLMVMPALADENLSVTGTVSPSPSHIHSITVLPNDTVQILFSDNNGYDDIIILSGIIQNLNNSIDYIEFSQHLYVPPEQVNIIPINSTYALYNHPFPNFFKYPNTYALRYTIRGNFERETFVQYYTPTNPCLQPSLTIDPIAFSPVEPGSYVTANLTIHNNDMPTLYITDLSFNDIILTADDRPSTTTLPASYITFTLPDEPLLTNSDLTIPITLFIPLGTKPANLETSGIIKLTTGET